MYARLPVFMFGHSMGGAIALLTVMEKNHFFQVRYLIEGEYALLVGNIFQGLVLTAPLVRSDKTHGRFSSAKRFLGKIMKHLSPSFQSGV